MNAKVGVGWVLVFSVVSLLASVCRCAHGQEEKVFLLESGKYTMTSVIRFSGKDKDEESKPEGVEVTVKADGSVTIVNPGQTDYPIVGKLEKNAFSATLDDAGGKVSLSGKLSGDNELTGTMTGTKQDGTKTLKGTFKLTKGDARAP